MCVSVLGSHVLSSDLVVFALVVLLIDRAGLFNLVVLWMVELLVVFWIWFVCVGWFWICFVCVLDEQMMAVVCVNFVCVCAQL